MHKPNILNLLSASLLALLLTTCGTRERPDQGLKGSVSISGAFALYPMVVMWAEKFQTIHPNVRIDISAGGAGKGMTDALTGMVDLGMISRSISEEELARGAWAIAVTRDAVLPVINSTSPFIDSIRVHGLTKSQFEGIYITGTIKSWSECYHVQSKVKINLYTRSDACGAGEMWAQYLQKKQEHLLGVGVFGDPGIADAVKSDPAGMGYNNVIFVYDINTRLPFPGLAILPLDQNGNRIIDPDENIYQNLDSVMNGIRAGRYPSPPARDLYLVSKGKPGNKVVTEFLRWILMEGQNYVAEAGYVQLTASQIEAESHKLQ